MRTDRRQFLQILAGGMLSLGLDGQLLHGRAASPYGRPKDAYVLEHLPPDLQPARKNPHLPGGVQQIRAGQDYIAKWQVPGIEYTVEQRPVRAVADGIVHFIGEAKDDDRTPRGHYVRVAHDRYDSLRKPFYPRITLYRYQAYRSTYYYLDDVDVQHWQSIKRGQILGRAGQSGKDRQAAIKLVLEERGNPVNPDDFGPRHSFMQNPAKRRPGALRLEEMQHRLDAQIDIVRRLDRAFRWSDRFPVSKKIHCYARTEKFYDFPVKWSTVEQFRFLCGLYHKDPGLFPTLSKQQHRQMTRQFYRLQPIVLTLPFK